MTDDVIAKAVAEATIHAPVASIDLAEWVFTLTDSEYQACSRNHIAAAATLTPDGKRMSINVEHVGNLMVQHYVEDLAEQSRCRLVSLSDSIGPDIASRVTVVVIWAFVVDAIDSGTTKFTNSVEVRSAPGYLEGLERRGVAFVNASEAAQQALSAHNAEETPLFARGIESTALAKRWGEIAPGGTRRELAAGLPGRTGAAAAGRRRPRRFRRPDAPRRADRARIPVAGGHHDLRGALPTGFCIEKIRTVDQYPGADDELSMEDDNTWDTRRQRSRWTATGTYSPTTSAGSRTRSTPRMKILRTGCGLARACGPSRPTEIGNDQRF